jgi:glutamate-5-semialdehyde dehydrogenase
MVPTTQEIPAQKKCCCETHAYFPQALERVAAALENAKNAIEAANKVDCEKAAKAEAGVAPALQSRLKFGGAKLRDTIQGVRDLQKLQDPINQVQLNRLIDDGLTLRRVTVPLGVLGIIFEARPDAAIQIAGLSIKSGNGVLLKCGRWETSLMMHACIHACMQAV